MDSDKSGQVPDGKPVEGMYVAIATNPEKEWSEKELASMPEWQRDVAEESRILVVQWDKGHKEEHNHAILEGPGCTYSRLMHEIQFIANGSYGDCPRDIRVRLVAVLMASVVPFQYIEDNVIAEQAARAMQKKLSRMFGTPPADPGKAG